MLDQLSIGLLTNVIHDGVKEGRKYIIPNITGFVVECLEEIELKKFNMTSDVFFEFFLDKTISEEVDRFRKNKTEPNLEKFITKLKQIFASHGIKADEKEFLNTFFQLVEKKITSNAPVFEKIQLRYLQTLSNQMNDLQKTTNTILEKITETSISSENSSIEFRPNPLLQSPEYINAQFNIQIKSFNKQVCSEYDVYPNYRPLIINFTKLKNGGFRFVRPKFRNLKTHEGGEDIFIYVRELIVQKVTEIEKMKELKKSITATHSDLQKIILPEKILAILNDKSITSDRTRLIREIRIAGNIPRNVTIWLEDEVILKNNASSEEKYEQMLQSNKEKLNRITTFETKIKELETERDSLMNIDLVKSSIPELELRNKRLKELSEEIDTAESQRDAELDRIDGYRKIIEKAETSLYEIKQKKEKLAVIQNNLSQLDQDKKELITKSAALELIVDGFLKMRQKLSILEANLRDVSSEKLIPIVGDYGSGKSSLCNHILNYLSGDDFDGPQVLFVPLGEIPKDSHNTLEKDIFNFVKQEYSFSFAEKEFIDLLNDGKFILILDALDEMSYKLDSSVGQKNLEKVISLAKKSIVILTSRHTYLSATMTKYLFEYHNLIKILDFELPEIEKFLNYKLQNQTDIDKILTLIKSDQTIEQLAKKPLFLEVINENFQQIDNYKIINEAIILTIFTNKWLIHDAKIKKQTNESEKIKLIESRQIISEILAFAKTGAGDLIGVDDVKSTVNTELGKIYPDAIDKLEEYYHDAINSTFLVKEENETFRFILNPVREFFIARRIVNDIKKNDMVSLLKHIQKIASQEIFDFIKGLIDIEWSVKSHIIEEILDMDSQRTIPATSQLNEEIDKRVDFLKKNENKSYVLYHAISKTRDDGSHENVGSLVRILHMTGNLPRRPNLSNLNLTDTNLAGIDLSGANLDNSNLYKSNLRGANLTNTSLVKTIFTESILAGVNFKNSHLNETKFNNADLNNADFQDLDLNYTDFTYSNLSNSDLRNVKLNNTKFQNANFSRAELGKIDFSHMELQNTIFAQTNVTDVKFYHANLTEVDFRGNDLAGIDFTDAILNDAKLNGSDLTATILHRAKCHRAKFAGAIMINTDLTKTELKGVKDLPITWEDALARGALV